MKYINKFHKLSELTNMYEISEFLFYNIPIGLIGTKNSDRILINDIVEKSGVKSYNFEKIIESIDEFIFEFVRVLIRP